MSFGEIPLKDVLSEKQLDDTSMRKANIAMRDYVPSVGFNKRSRKCLLLRDSWHKGENEVEQQENEV